MCIIKRTCFKDVPAMVLPVGPMPGERGSALIITLVVLVVLTLLGIIATRTSITELKTSASDKRHRITFYGADGATELAGELLEQNIEELVFDGSVEGFDADNDTFSNYDTGDDASGDVIPSAAKIDIKLNMPDFWRNEDKLATTPIDGDDATRDFYLPANYAAGAAHTNFAVGGHPEFLSGSSIPMAAGYEGLGKKSGSGGTMNVFEIITQRIGENNSESIVRVQWRHVN